MKTIHLLVFILISHFTVGQQITNLLCDFESNPLAVNHEQPELSWNIRSTARGERQTAYQILVASSVAKLYNNIGDLWNSDKVLSDQNLYIPYGGKKLNSGEQCFWKVKIWNKEGKPSGWSACASWTVGLLKPSDWTAKWITASNWFTLPEFRPKGLELKAKGGWADIDLGRKYEINQIRLYPNSINSFPRRFRILVSDTLNFYTSKTIIDHTQSDNKLIENKAQVFDVGKINARYVRLQILADSPVKSFDVRQIEVMSSGKNVALMKFTREFGTDWDHGHAPFLVDGMPSQNDGDVCPANACPNTAAPMFRKSFSIPKKIKKATLYVAALGMVDVTLNGKKIGNEVLGPPFSDYYKRIIYTTHDITGYLKQGENVLGTILGNGFFSTPALGFGQRHGGDGAPRFLMQVQITFTDQSTMQVISDETWKWTRSSIIFNDIWKGYEEDRRLDKPGWNKPRYDDTNWQSARAVDAPKGKMWASIGPPIQVNALIKPSKVKGNHAYFDKVYVGWPLLRVKGKAGQKIVITGEGKNYQTSKMTFILAKDGTTFLSPNFILQPCPTDMKIEGLTTPLSINDISIKYINANLKTAGTFTCSNPFYNRIYDALVRTHRNYIYDFPADPNREKQGWTQDVQNMFSSAAYLTDVHNMYVKWWWDMADNQDEQGLLGSVVPMVNRQVYDWNSPWWSGAIVYLPWSLYQYYGDIRILKQGYEPMKKYVDFLQKMAQTGDGGGWDDYPYLTNNLNIQAAKDTMIIWNGAGDWLNPYIRGQHAVPTPVTTMTAWYYYTTLISKMATMFGENQDVLKYDKMAKDIKRRFNATYLNPVNGLYADSANNQTAQVLPLAVGIVPQDKQSLTYQRLIDAIHARNNHIGTGFVATPFLLQTLAEHRESKLGNEIVNQRDYPGWNTLIKNGVMFEDWSGGGAQMPSCGGAVGEWFYQSVLGIQPDSASPGFKKFILAPQPDISTGLTFAKGYYDGVYGRIGSDWKIENGQFFFHVSIPVNTSATVYFPTDKPSEVMESDKPISNIPGIKFIKADENVAVYEVQSGDYYFKAPF